MSIAELARDAARAERLVTRLTEDPSRVVPSATVQRAVRVKQALACHLVANRAAVNAVEQRRRLEAALRADIAADSPDVWFRAGAL